MFPNSFSNLKKIGKSGLDFIKSLTFGTITSLRDDIREEISLRKEIRERRKSKKDPETPSQEG